MMKRGKAADIDDLSVEHFCHPVLSVLLSKFKKKIPFAPYYWGTCPQDRRYHCWSDLHTSFQFLSSSRYSTFFSARRRARFCSWMRRSWRFCDVTMMPVQQQVNRRLVYISAHQLKPNATDFCRPISICAPLCSVLRGSGLVIGKSSSLRLRAVSRGSCSPNGCMIVKGKVCHTPTGV